jgi:hypothetical protein
MPPRQRFPRLNSRFDLKHIRDDFSQLGLKDPVVYDLAAKRNRLIITFNGTDFKKLIGLHMGVITAPLCNRNRLPCPRQCSHSPSPFWPLFSSVSKPSEFCNM